MDALNFSSGGVRWRVTLVTNGADAPDLPPGLREKAGLLFVADDGERRFLALGPDAVRSIDLLREKSNDELGRLAQLAVVVAS